MGVSPPQTDPSEASAAHVRPPREGLLCQLPALQGKKASESRFSRGVHEFKPCFSLQSETRSLPRLPLRRHRARRRQRGSGGRALPAPGAAPRLLGGARGRAGAERSGAAPPQRREEAERRAGLGGGLRGAASPPSSPRRSSNGGSWRTSISARRSSQWRCMTRAGESRDEPGFAVPSWAELSHAEPGFAVPSCAEPCRTGLSHPVPCEAGL